MSCLRRKDSALVSRAWLANLDADLELAKIGPYQTPNVLLRQIRAQEAALACLLQGEALLDATASRVSTPLPRVVCWCPTPSALAWLAKRGLCTGRAPPVQVLREVNDRLFTLKFLGGPVERRAVLQTSDLDFLGSGVLGRAWRLKRRFGFAGKGQRVIQGVPTADDERWLSDALRAGGLIAEPEREVVAEFSSHGYLDGAGLLLGELCRQRCDAHGQVVSVERAVGALPELEQAARDHMACAMPQLADQLQAHGYFGPFGMDIFAYRGALGIGWSLFSDVNARFSLGWSTGMGVLREQALERLLGQT
jgi:hypothetical protein